MLPNCRAYHRPGTAAEAAALIAEGNAPLGGGTMLALSSHPGIAGLVDLSGVITPSLEDNGAEFSFSATATMTQVANFFTGRPYATALLGRAAANYLTRPVRNRATVGGVLAGAHGWAEVAAALVVLGAKIQIVRKAGEETILYQKALRPSIEKNLARGFILRLVLPKENLAGGSSRVAKTETDIPIVSAYAALKIDGGVIREARIAITGANGGPHRAQESEAAILMTAVSETTAGGKKSAACALDEASERALAGLEPASDARASGAYRRRVIPVVVRRALEECLGSQARG